MGILLTGYAMSTDPNPFPPLPPEGATPTSCLLASRPSRLTKQLICSRKSMMTARPANREKVLTAGMLDRAPGEDGKHRGVKCEENTRAHAHAHAHTHTHRKGITW